MNAELASQFVKNLAEELGFMACGISEARELEEEKTGLENWLRNGYQGTMSWMENHIEKRLDPRKLVPGCKSVISLIYNYFPDENLDKFPYRISKYAYGEDYHFVLKEKLKTMLNRIREQFGNVEGRVFVDSAPVMERAWAARSGLGWIGKHSLLLNKKSGSFFFIAELLLDIDLMGDAPATDHCGTCTACIDACPTSAIISDRIVDSNRCISYLTIELKGNIPEQFGDKMQGWVFGCDICQDVCPWNRFSKPHKEAAFKPSEGIKKQHIAEWKELTEDVFKDLFKKSAVKRAGHLKLKNSIDLCKNK